MGSASGTPSNVADSGGARFGRSFLVIVIVLAMCAGMLGMGLFMFNMGRDMSTMTTAALRSTVSNVSTKTDRNHSANAHGAKTDRFCTIFKQQFVV